MPDRARQPDPFEDDAEARALEHALEVLDACREGVLKFEDHAVPLRFVAEHGSGRLVAAVPVAALLASDLVLVVPEDTDDALQIMVSPEELAEGRATDRWQAYHGEPEHVRWGVFWIDGARHGGFVFDGEAMMRANPLEAAEPALVKLANANQAALGAACQRYAGLVVPSPVCVGVDPGGLHVRARFGVVRVPFESRAGDEAVARATIEKMTGTSSSSR